MIKISTGLLIYPSFNLPLPSVDLSIAGDQCEMQSMFETIKLNNDKFPTHRGPLMTKCPTMAKAIKCWARVGMLGTDSAIRKYNHVDGSINYVKFLQCRYISDR